MSDKSSPRREPIVIGWREYISLPDWGASRIKAKADTGARTSAIDVADLEVIADDRVRFSMVVDRSHPECRVEVEANVARWGKVKSSLGARHSRPIIETRLKLGSVEKVIELGLVCRKNMLCRMLLGRTALAPDFVVDASRRYVLGRKRGKSQESHTPRDRR